MNLAHRDGSISPPVEHKQEVRSLRVAASWQVGIPESGQDAQASSRRYQARCADQDPDLFFPVGTGGPAARQALRAKAVCAQCPVRSECLAWAIDTHQPHGVWGGLDEQERERLQALSGAPLEATVARPA